MQAENEARAPCVTRIFRNVCLVRIWATKACHGMRESVEEHSLVRSNRPDWNASGRKEYIPHTLNLKSTLYRYLRRGSVRKKHET